MSIFIVTGKLGGGKTLAAVSRINDALAKGRKVATNLDLELVNFPSVGRRARDVRVIRVPDRPSVDDIRSIGFGIEGVTDLRQARRCYDESRFGLLVLDECGTWLNSREWQAEGRRELINYLLHIRKHLWDVYFIIQDISSLDKQARKALAEHVVYCRRMDRLSIPFVGTIVGWFWGDRPKLPQLHLCIVKYGDQPQSITVDKWWFRGTDLWDAYDTTQVFVEDYPHGVYSMLAPWYLYRRSFVSWDWRKAMRLTQVYLRQYSRTLLLTAGVLFGAVGVNALTPEPEIMAEDSAPVVADENQPGGFHQGEGKAAALVEIREPELPLIYRLRVHSVYSKPNGGEEIFFTDGHRKLTKAALWSLGVSVAKTGACRYRFDHGPDHSVVGCFD